MIFGKMEREVSFQHFAARYVGGQARRRTGCVSRKRLEEDKLEVSGKSGGNVPQGGRFQNFEGLIGWKVAAAHVCTAREATFQELSISS
jgi:hypothetical protein